MTSSGGYQEYAAIADLYDHVVPYRDRSDVEFFVEATKAANGPVLEVGCGTGRVLIPTARAGVDVVGLDMSAAMLAQCRARLQQESNETRARVQLIRADMRDFELDRSFNLVTLPFRPFQHLTTVEEQLGCLAAIRRHLVTGGRIILDVFNPWLEKLVEDNLGQEYGQEPEFTAPDGRRVIRRHKVVARDLFNQVIHGELIYDVTHPDGREQRLVQPYRLRYLFRFEAEHLLVRSGFEIEALYSDYERQPYGAKYPGELIFVARKASA
ncbi:MAG: class I SAM-dependent methyltransferase [Candidatus Promineifilaceae bacterium]|nr:class I SAM-dependent methyltransferase [Candidatus Promineifilaceae bacterium]